MICLVSPSWRTAYDSERYSKVGRYGYGTNPLGTVLYLRVQVLYIHWGPGSLRKESTPVAYSLTRSMDLNGPPTPGKYSELR